jgi:hypothetical protein
MPAGDRRSSRDILALFRRQFTRSCPATLLSTQLSEGHGMRVLLAPRFFPLLSGSLCRDSGGEFVQVAWFA